MIDEIKRKLEKLIAEKESRYAEYEAYQDPEDHDDYLAGKICELSDFISDLKAIIDGVK